MSLYLNVMGSPGQPQPPASPSLGFLVLLVPQEVWWNRRDEDRALSPGSGLA